MSNPSLLCVPYRFKTSTLYSQIPDSGLGDFVVTRSASNAATRVNDQGFIETVADNVPRLDYPLGGITAGCPALLVEPAATNSIRNNSMVGASVSGNALPTNYILQLAGLTRTIVGTGTENGIAYMDIRVSGTSTGGAVVLQEESSTFITAAQGQVWTHSVYMKLIANVLNMPSVRVGMYEYTSGAVYLGEGSNPFTLTTSLNRFSFTRTLANASTTRVAPIVQWLVNNGTSYDFTIRIGYPQMETGSVATSVIPTTTAAITRGADVISRTSASALIGQSEGTIYAEVDIRNLTNADSVRIVSLTTTTNSNNFIEITKRSATQLRCDARLNSSTTTIFLTVSGFVLGVNKIAFAYQDGNYAMAINGAVTTSTQVGMTSSLNTIILGAAASNIAQFNDRIRAAALYPTRLTNAQLQSLTQ